MMKHYLLSTIVLLLAMGRPSSSRQRWSGFAEAAETRSDIVRVKHHHHHPEQPQERQPQHGSSSSHAWETPDNSSTTALSSAIIWKESQGSLFLNNQGQTETATETLRGRFRYVFGAGLQQRKKKKRGVGRWRTFYEPFRPSIVRRLENDNAADDDAYYKSNDDANDDAANDDAAAANDDGNNDDNKNDDLYSVADERCSEFLVSFLEGTTDAHDTCEGMMNAYSAAGT